MQAAPQMIRESGTDAVGGPGAGVVDVEERHWLPRHARGEAGAFDELLRTYRSLVLTLLVRWGIGPDHRDDVFQDVFLKIHLAAATYRPSEPLRPWLVSIVLNTVRNFRRDSARRRRHMSEAPTHNRDTTSRTGDGLPDPLAAMPSSDPQPDDSLDRTATLAWLEHRIAELPEAQRDVLVLATVRGLRMKEIAGVLDLPENTVKTHLRRARLALAEALAGRDHPAAAAGGAES